MGVNVQIEGMDEIINQLKQMGDKIENKGINNAVREGAKVVQKAIEEVAPKSDSPRQPNGNERWRTGEHAGDNVPISRMKTKDGMKTKEVGWDISDTSPYFYMKFLEWGTSKMSARPFMNNAINNSQNEVKNVMKEEIRKVINN